MTTNSRAALNLFLSENGVADTSGLVALIKDTNYTDATKLIELLAEEVFYSGASFGREH